MNIGIAHFTDIHFTAKTDFKLKMPSLIKSLADELHDVHTLYIVISGDIANGGKEIEYKAAKSFLSILKVFLQKTYTKLSIKHVIVPGNHDCDVEDEQQIRKNTLVNVNYSTLGNDDSVINLCLTVQNEFWNFYSEYNPTPENKLLYKVTDEINGHGICFHCINTGWMSQRGEKPGSIFFPVNHFDTVTENQYIINIGVWHHPYNWFTPNTPENNKKEFEKYTERIAPIHLLGHEHEHELYLNENLNTGDRINLISGKLLNKDSTPKDSGFHHIKVNLESREGELKKYDWSSKENLYLSVGEQKISFIRDQLKRFSLKDDFMAFLDEVKIPITIPNKKVITLSDVYIFPDLESTKSDSRKFDSYLDSSSLLNSNNQHSLIDGENQIGKTSLLHILYLRLYESNNFPILLNGTDFKDLNLEKIIRKAFRKQYKTTSDDDYSIFQQQDSKKKILLIDDFQEFQFNSTTAQKILEEAKIKFGKVYITIDAAHSILPSMQAELQSFKFYSIKPLGYRKRNELIEKYHYLKEDPYTYDEQKFITTIKNSFDNIQNVLGEKLIPPYPIFILSILQALEYKPLKQNETSFGYCYQTLIHYSLHIAGVSNDDLDTYFNFLAELAYYYIINDTEKISDTELLDFYSDYKKRFIVPTYETVIGLLKKSKIIISNDLKIGFGYDYILYYLSAKKISDIIHTESGQLIITKLFKDLQIERNANILVFVTHHSKDISFIEQSILSTMYALDKTSPITLEKDDKFYDAIKGIANEMSIDILETHRNPKEERSKLLKLKDEKDENGETYSKDIPENIKAIVLPFQQAFRSIEIVGQIVKNRKGSLEIPQLKQMITEVYTTGFRAVGYISEILISSRNEIIDTFNKDMDQSIGKSAVEEKLNELIMAHSFQTCLSVFSKLTMSLGHKDLKPIFSEVAMELNTPAAKLVSFGINSYYGSISLQELKSLAEEFNGNPIALKMLRIRLKNYVYNRKLDFKVKQQFASCLQMNLGPKNPNIS